MKKSLAALAALTLMAMPFAGIAEEAPVIEQPTPNLLEYAMGNFEVSINGAPLDLTGLEIDGVTAMNKDGSIYDSTQFYVGERMAVGMDLLVDSSLWTFALRGTDGIYLTPAFAMDLSKIASQFVPASGTEDGSGDISALITEYYNQFMGAMGIVVNRLSQIEPQQSVLENYQFCDGTVSDLNIIIFSLDPDTLNAIIADVAAYLNTDSPINADGISLQFVMGLNEEGRTVYSLALSKDETSYSLDIQLFDSDGKTLYAAAYVNGNAIADLLGKYSLVENTLNSQLTLNVAGQYSVDIHVAGESDGPSFSGKLSCNALVDENTLTFFSDMYLAAAYDEALAAGADLKTLETADFMALAGDPEALSTLLEGWKPYLTDSLNLLSEVPGIALILQSALSSAPAPEAIGE